MRFHRNKFRVAPAAERFHNGRTYASKAEMMYAQQLDALKEARAIIEYIEQPKFRLGCPENVYVADFLVWELTDFEGYNVIDCYVVDIKGVETPKFRHDRKLWAAYGMLPLHIVKRVGGKFKTVAVIEPGQQRRAAA